MIAPMVLLVDENVARQDRLRKSLAAASLDVFCVHDGKDCEEALALRRFDAVLVSAASSALIAGSIRAATQQKNPPVLLFAFEDMGGGIMQGLCDAQIRRDTPDEELAGEISRLFIAAKGARSAAASQLAAFDLAAFRTQMGGDPELMSEIVGLFFEESGSQIRELRTALDAKDYHRVSRVAHSLKGSLGSLHAAQSLHWAQALEAAAITQNHDRSERCLQSLEQTIASLEPELQPLLLK